MTGEERFVVAGIVNRALDKGYLLTVNDGEDFPVMHSDDAEEVMAELGHCEEEWLYVENADRKKIGTIFLVYGNDPDEVVCDCTDKPEILEIVG
jgi:sorbitol-specific phosphotransferase system component IIA